MFFLESNKYSDSKQRPTEQTKNGSEPQFGCAYARD